MRAAKLMASHVSKRSVWVRLWLFDAGWARSTGSAYCAIVGHSLEVLSLGEEEAARRLTEKRR